MRHLLLAATAAFAPLSAHASALSNVLDSVRVHATHPPPRLSDAERLVYEGLRDQRWGERVRLEQERIGFGWVLRHL